jgi:DNA-binding Lrp family transcriptional regulator
MPENAGMNERSTLDPIDRRIVVATQAGLPLVPRPFAAVAAEVGIEEADVIERLRRMAERGALRRIAAVPNHYALGYVANGMSVWDVDDGQVGKLGPAVGALPFVTHCYLRPRRLPVWPYNLFAMIHGKSRDEVEAGVREVANLLGEAARIHDVLYSVRILKKTGLRLAT